MDCRVESTSFPSLSLQEYLVLRISASDQVFILRTPRSSFRGRHSFSGKPPPPGDWRRKGEEVSSQAVCSVPLIVLTCSGLLRSLEALPSEDSPLFCSCQTHSRSSLQTKGYCGSVAGEVQSVSSRNHLYNTLRSQSPRP